MRIVIWDTETNGLPSRNPINKQNDFSEVSMLQISIIIYDTKTKKNLVEREWLVRGDFEISEKITEITGITKKMTEDSGEPIARVWRSVNRFIAKYECKYNVAHNAEFDIGVVTQEYMRLKHITQEFNPVPWPIINALKKQGVLHESIVMRFKYHKRLLIKLYKFCEKHKSPAFKDILAIYRKHLSSDAKIYQDPIFKLFPICSMNDMFKRFEWRPDRRNMIKKIMKDNRDDFYEKDLWCQKDIQLYPLYYKLYDLDASKYILNHRLETIHDWLFTEKYIQKHTALDDCWLLQKCMDKVGYKIESCIFKQ